jgi:putative tryptophan/tyrosine transport system substrate-binding protein
MRRREFITLLGGAAAGWPFAVRAQQKWRVGVLVATDPSYEVLVRRIAAFREVVAAEIVVRAANNQFDKLPTLASDLVKQGVQAIYAIAPLAVRAARETTSSVPIVALDLESDPVANGWATSLAHPGGNVTGIFLDLPEFSTKILQLLHEAVPGITKVAVLWHPESGSLQLESVRTAASALNLKLEVFQVSRPADFNDVFQEMAKSQADGVLMLSSVIFAGNLPLLADLARRNRLPAVNIFPDFAQNGGLVGYGPDLDSLFVQAGLMTRKLLQGASVANPHRTPDALQARSKPQDGERARPDTAYIHFAQR